jgi:nucleoside-diphosphate-sugar epimerase
MIALTFGLEDWQMQNNKLTILVTGGSGYIGRLLCEKLASLDYNVINVDRSKREIAGVTQYPFDLGNIQIKGLMALLQPHAVIHLASENLSTNAPTAIYQTNVADTISMMNYAISAGVKNFLFSGYTQCVDSVSNAYFNSKNMIDQIIADYASAYGVRFLSLKYPIVVGVDPNSKHNTESQFTEMVRTLVKNPSAQHAEVARKYIHIMDVIDAHVQALTNLTKTPDNGVIQLIPAKEYTDLEIANMVNLYLQEKTTEPVSADVSNYSDFDIKHSMEQIVYHTLKWVKTHK